MKNVMKSERELILSDALMCSVLKEQADKVGVSLEEYVDRFLKVFYEDPDRFVLATYIEG